MRSEALDITIESRGRSIWLFLSGPFHGEQVPSMQEKLSGLIDDGCRHLVIDLENVTDVDDAATQMFLALLNSMRAKGGDIWFIFRNENVSRAFAQLKSIFSIYPDAHSLPAGGFIGTLRRRSKVLARTTGIRLSRPVALTLLISLFGWILSLIFIIHIQGERIRKQEADLRGLTEWNRTTVSEIHELQNRLRPLEQLGILKDTLSRKSP